MVDVTFQHFLPGNFERDLGLGTWEVGHNVEEGGMEDRLNFLYRQ